jgi:hypothetical protein
MEHESKTVEVELNYTDELMNQIIESTGDTREDYIVEDGKICLEVEITDFFTEDTISDKYGNHYSAPEYSTSTYCDMWGNEFNEYVIERIIGAEIISKKAKTIASLEKQFGIGLFA